MQSANWTFYKYQRSRSFPDLSSGCLSIFNFSSKPAGLMKPNYMWSLWGMGEWKFIQLIWVTWPRRPPCQYMVKTLWKSSSQNWKADDIETWYAASGTQALPSLTKWWPLGDLEVKVEMGSLGIWKGKKGKTGFFWSYCSLWHQRWFMQSAKWTFINTKDEGYLLTFGPRSLRSSNFKILSKSTRLIETELHTEEPQWDWEIKVCSWDLGHMTKMAVIPIHGKKDLKFFISETERPMTLKLDTQYWGLWLYLIY